MKFFTTATLNWFDDGCCDVKFLDLWNDAPLSYFPGQQIDDSWHQDHVEQRLGVDESGALFNTAVSLLKKYRFYPKDVMSFVGDFELEERQMKIGDRIVQRIHLLHLFGRPVLDAVTMIEIIDVIDEPRRYGFTYATVDTHVKQGEWTAVVEWQENGDVVLIMKAISRPIPHEPARNYQYMRAFQRKAHQLGMEYFKQSVLNTSAVSIKS
ncbi:MAG: DUF1990 family protein [Chloroflexi bacterium]|nr:DUF1990 family protein [Chloroflexota bacterium]